MESSSLQIIHAQVVTPRGIIKDGAVSVENGVIRYVGTTPGLASAGLSTHEAIDAQGAYVLPGFIDIHVHGGMLQDFSAPSKQAFDDITKLHLSQGTTSMLATTMTMPKEVIDAVLEEVHRYIEDGMPYAKLAGVHLEGPFINPNWPGAQNPAHIVPPNKAWVEQWNAKYPGLIKQVTLAPEQEGAHELIAFLRSQAIVAAAGHTDATYEEIMSAVEVGLHHAVHTFNAMTPFHHRKPGTAGAVLSSPAISAEIIADGIHVHKAGIQLLAQVKNNRNLILITDAMSAAGLGNGDYMLGDLPVVVKDNVCTLKEDEGTLAGSTLTMIRGFRHLVQEIGMTIEQASEAASGNPARLLRIDHSTGSIETGKLADLLLVSTDLQLEKIWVEGRAFQSELQ
ncbi:N-acetylglucosamine-6-phosphate deacetylase [Paenibacillus antibioticophila]|uniref:N-acetylglucosamine-6-phosphate deacetylase n=1 Tax=Paenibacillus antibioticophila TaxID=1274374 RepID=UPI0005CAA3E3|nr:N-acetylglucosamine-6-phosphate deacetylase [Paenibacillus antibioticophila]